MKALVKNISAIALSAAGLMMATTTLAYQQGDMILRAGGMQFTPDVDSGNLKAGGADVNVGGAPTTVDVDNNSQLGLSLTYMLSDNLGLSLLASTPFNHTITTKGGLSSLGKLADVKHMTPTLMVQYYPMEKASAFQPYVGLGLNYTRFYDESFKGTNKTSFTDLDLDDSLGLALQAGFDYALADNVGLNASISWADVDTQATFTGAGAFPGTRFKLDAELDPMIYTLGVSYSF
ncbi:OmpW/AlkL family protein [Parendozoicomonas haliclonae]|uniref:Outer membrane protein W n=1 Tax=Parendozoicomonas haliclonae TaxID=1960125 RepID=A0A1X7AJ91_9GAMM|nr:OmpW family outer membrane protein [Parendozoicomonas haliclonae]SMA40600.1 Outer membrane protein W precursor [Parendozoicomonas haliclonae]